MPSSKRPEWEVRIHAKQFEVIDVDLMAQIVLMLGREMIEDGNEANEGDDHEPDDPQH